jgi:hypothetical protein
MSSGNRAHKPEQGRADPDRAAMARKAERSLAVAKKLDED